MTAIGLAAWMLVVAAGIAPVIALMWRGALRRQFRGCGRP